MMPRTMTCCPACIGQSTNSGLMLGTGLHWQGLQSRTAESSELLHGVQPWLLLMRLACSRNAGGCRSVKPCLLSRGHNVCHRNV